MIAVLLAALVLITVTFILENQQEVTLSFASYSLPSLPVSALLVVALVAGLSVGPLLVMMTAWRTRGPRKKPLSGA
nr:lipopolysaccharide assembly protein LapA domain-containing protein [Pseudomonas donghuensis]